MEATNMKQKTLTSFFNSENKRSSTSNDEPTTSSFTPQDENEARVKVSSTSQDLVTGKPIDSWPSIWTQEMWERKKGAFPWLDCCNGKLGCKICKEVVQLGAFKQ